MWLTRTAVHRPITTLMAAVVILLLGFTALTNLSVDLMPHLQFPTVTVETIYPGAGPEEIETLVTRPLEQALGSVNGFERLSSRSLEGSSSIRVQFQWGTSLDTAIADMRQSIDKIADDLPDEIDPPLIRRYDVNDSPVMYLGVQSKLPLPQLTRFIERNISPRLERLDGVARVGMRGEVRREIQVNLDRAKLEALGMGVNEVIAALAAGNVNQPAGDYDEGNLQRLVRSRTEFESLRDVEDLVVRRRADALVRIRDVAEVVDGHEEITQLTRLNGQSGIMIYVFQQSGANTIDVSDAVQAAVADLNSELRDAELVVRVDKSNFVRQSIRNMRQAAGVGMLLAMVVLVLFLRSFRSTLVIAVSMPLSVLATFVLIYFSGFSLNMVSFGGIVLGLGMLVDNSIVVLESIFRKRSEGLSAEDAAVEGTGEVVAAITASTLTTLIVFLPLLFVEGMTRVLVHQLALAVSFSLVCSLLASVTLTPALAAHWIRATPDSETDSPGRLRRLSSPLHGVTRRMFGVVERGYERLLGAALGNPGLTAFSIMFVFCATVGLLPRIGTEFLPQPDDGQLGVRGTMAPATRLEQLDQQTRRLEAEIEKLVPEAESIAVFVGDEAEDGDDWHECRFFVQLPPRTERDDSVTEIRSRVDEKLPPIAGMRIKTRVRSALPIFRMFGSSDGDGIAVLVRGHDLRTSEELANAVAALMRSVPGMVNVELQQDERRPELSTLVDRSKASLLDIQVRDITQTLETAIRGTPATVFREDGDEFNITVRLRESDRGNRADLGQVGIATPEGRIVALRNLVRFEPGESPLTIDRLDRQRVAVITAGAEGRDLGSVVGDLEEKLAALPLPDGFTIEIGGDWEEQQESFRLLVQGFILAVILMYVVMAAQFESLRDPLLILTALPLSGIGVLLVFVYWETTLNVQSFIGLIVLAGIVVNNAIVLVDYINQLRRRRPEDELGEIIQCAATRRLRPVLMTTMTTVLGMLPIAIGSGAGGELQAPLARVIVGGLLSGTVMTLLAIPVGYWLAATFRLMPAVEREERVAVGAR